MKLYIAFRNKDFEKIKQICKDISKKDSNFKYRFFDSKDKTKADKILSVNCENINQGHKRGLWFIKKCCVGEFYWVK